MEGWDAGPGGTVGPRAPGRQQAKNPSENAELVSNPAWRCQTRPGRAGPRAAPVQTTWAAEQTRLRPSDFARYIALSAASSSASRSEPCTGHVATPMLMVSFR